MTKRQHDRAARDVGNILAMEHVNVTVPDQSLATFFYVNLLGFTRDAYMEWGPFNVWVNVGRQQFHLPTAKAQVVRGHIGVVVPNLANLNNRLERMSKRLGETDFTFKVRAAHTDVTCPWGNRIRCFGPGKFRDMQLGIPYVEFDVPANTAAGIARFYETVMGCHATLSKSGTQCAVAIGREQTLRFREVKRPVSDYDGHHIAIYVSDFSGPHQYLKSRDLITEESDTDQYRFQTIIDPASGEPLFEIEHEVRSLYHPMYERVLLNRDPAQSFFDYQRDRDAFVPERLIE